MPNALAINPRGNDARRGEHVRGKKCQHVIDGPPHAFLTTIHVHILME